jgi:hypothetical protein
MLGHNYGNFIAMIENGVSMVPMKGKDSSSANEVQFDAGPKMMVFNIRSAT